MFAFSIMVGLIEPGHNLAVICIFAVGTAVLLLGLWERVVRFQAQSWPTAQGVIDLTSVQETSGKRRRWVARLDYSFPVFGRRYTGRYSRAFGFQDDAQDWIRDLQGSTVAVHYWPGWPASSLVSDDDVELLLKSRLPEVQPPAPQAMEAAGGCVIRMVFAYAFMALAAAGFGLSLYAHIGSWLGRILLPQSWFVMLHISAVLIFLPALLLSPKQGRRRRNDPGAIPGVLVSVMIVFLVYALANFALFLIFVATHHNKATPLMEWRGLSGHWMVFYLWAFAFLYPTARLRGRRSPAPGSTAAVAPPPGT